MPASGISMSTSSGVSMLSWSESQLPWRKSSPTSGFSSAGPTGTGSPPCWPNPTRAAWDSSPAPNCRRWPCSTARWRQTSPCCARTRPRAPTRARQSIAGSRPPYHLFRPQDQSAHPLPLPARRVSGHLSAPDWLCRGLAAGLRGLWPAGRGAHQRAAGVHAALRRPGDDRHHGAPQDVDRIHGQRGAHGFQPHHDQQPFGQLCHLCRRASPLAWEPSSLLFKTA